MKKIKLIWTLVLLMMASVALPSCMDDDDEAYVTILPNALVTLKTNPTDGTFYMQLDESTILVPTNIKESPYGDKEVRAFINFSQETTSPRTQAQDVYVNWIDSIRTKDMDIHLGNAANAMTYGNDPLEIVNSWETVVEDGYLTLRFRTYFGMGNVHYLRLTRGDNPYEVVLYHDANGDYHGQVGDGCIAFRLNDLPDTKGETVNLTLKWESFTGEKSTQFKYCSRN